MQTLYDVLGVSWKASDDQIRAAFRRSVKTCHPDLHAGDRAAERQLRQVLAAYEILRRPQKKIVYDRYLKQERRMRHQRVGLTAFTGFVCCTAIATLTLWLPKMTDDASALPQPPAIAMAIADAHEQVQVASTKHGAVTDHGVRAEVNSNSKSDRIAVAFSAFNNQTAAAEPPQAASKPRPAPVRRAEPQPRLAKEWGRIRQSEDPMAIAAFAARHPDASESRLARSKLIGLIDTADDLSLLNILGLGDGEIAERAQQRLTRLRTAHAKETKDEAKEDAEAASDALKDRAASFVSARVAGWSSTSVINLAAHTSAYADEVLYNGSRKSRQAVAREKRRLLEVWPERSYEVRPASISVNCLANVCKVDGVVDWQTRNAARAASASGIARFDYEVALARGTFRILSESLSDLKRPRQAASCSTKGGDTVATSKKIRELHRDAARCLQMAGRTSPARLKTALLAHAQMLQRARQEVAHVVSSFNERWLQTAVLR